jgi:hypothetical protein
MVLDASIYLKGSTPMPAIAATPSPTLAPTPLPARDWPQNTRNNFFNERVAWTSKILTTSATDLNRLDQFVFDKPDTPEVPVFIAGISKNIATAQREFSTLVPSDRQAEALNQVVAGVAQLGKDWAKHTSHGGDTVEALGFQQDLQAADVVLKGTHRGLEQ